MDNFSRDHSKLRSKIYNQLMVLLRDNPAEYRAGMKRHLQTQEIAGLIHAFDGSMGKSELGARQWGNTMWEFTGRWDKN